MLLCLDIGNTQIFGGVFDEEKIVLQFRKSSRLSSSSDEIGIFFRGVLRENNFNPKDISSIAMCSVVPDVVYSIRNGCIKYFGIDPFILQAGVKTGLKIKYLNINSVDFNWNRKIDLNSSGEIIVGEFPVVPYTLGDIGGTLSDLYSLYSFLEKPDAELLNRLPIEK